MSGVGVAGAGAFGTALAIALTRAGRDVTLWTRSAKQAEILQKTRENVLRLPNARLPDSLTITCDIAGLDAMNAVLVAVPMQALAGVLNAARQGLNGTPLVACCKGISLATGTGPTAIIAAACPDSTPAILTGPSFAADIARGLPTALTLACRDADQRAALQRMLSTPVLRLYGSHDTTGAEFGGALKNVIAIASGIVIGAGLGDSARAALMTRGFSELRRIAMQFGAETETLFGLSGFGDLVLTCTSGQSRNFRFGQTLGRGDDAGTSQTVEGVATARAVSTLAASIGLDAPICTMVANVLDQKCGIADAVDTLLARPLKEE